MAAAEKFKAPENPATCSDGAPNPLSQPILEESEEEEEVSITS